MTIEQIQKLLSPAKLYSTGTGMKRRDPWGWSWTALVLLELQFVVNTCVYVIGYLYTKWFNSRPSIEGATGVCHLAPSLFV
jgi:hypothetical protein